jgi:hypothetical protein
MTIVGADWHTGELLPENNEEVDPRYFQGYDLHVLRGTASLPLNSILLLIDDARHFIRADATPLPAGVSSIVFFPEFEGVIAGGVKSGGGVRVNMLTGAVEAPAAPPSPRLRSFLVTPVINLAAGGSVRGPQLRACIHENVTEIWLTPSTLTLPGDAEGQRFSVLARFDDDTVGDITRLAGAPSAAGQPPEPGFTWTSSDNVCARVDAQGRLSGLFSLFSCSSTITATLRQPNWPALSASAQVTVVEPWGDQRPTKRELRLVGGPGVDGASEVPNILILPDGFMDTDADRDYFDKLVSLIVHRLNTSPSTTPFDWLSGSINYWTVFVPSRENGTNTLADLVELPSLFEGATQTAKTPVTTLAVDGQRLSGDSQIDFVRATLYGELPAGVHFTIAGDPTLYTTTNHVTVQNNALRGVQFTPVLARTASNNSVVTIIGRRMRTEEILNGFSTLPWIADVAELIHVVGLPVPAERRTRGATQAEVQAKVADWTTLYGQRIHPANITNFVYDFWSRWLPDHRLADEKDTAFGLAVGERPRAAIRRDDSVITWHPLRTSRRDLDKFLATLTFEGTVLGTTWTVHDGVRGKDRELVFVLAAGARYSGSNLPGSQPIIAMGLVDDMDVRISYGAGRSMQIVPHPLPRDQANAPDVTNGVHGRIAHEAAHSFGILDEYGGRPSMPAGGIEVERTFDYGNVTTLGEVMVPDGIMGDKLRWRWPRIVNAGVLAAAPVPEPGDASVFTIQLRPGHPINVGFNLFQVGDTVFLRQRPLLKPPVGNPKVLNIALVSPPLTVISPTRPLAENAMQVRLQSGALDPNDFSATGVDAPILFAPMPAAAAAAAGDKPAEIMAQFIREHINLSKRPLNAPPLPPPPAPQQPWVCAQPAGNGFMEPQPATNLPPEAQFPGHHYPPIKSRIVGAYEGGAAFSCGIYHPTGSCIMRAPLALHDEQTNTVPPITFINAYEVHSFCYVCRYLLIDRIDPRLHGRLDSSYLDYPQP